MFGFWRQQQNTRRCLRCLISAVASLWLADVAPLLCGAHDGTHSHLLSGHYMAAETHEHAYTQAAFDIHSHHQHEAGQAPDSHCEPVGDTYWALTMTLSPPSAIVLPEPLLSSTNAPGHGAALPYYPPRPDTPPRAV